MNLILAASLLAATAALPPREVSPSPEPDVNLSGIRLISCNEGSGTGFVVGENVLATALHVARMTGCKDSRTGDALATYHRDPTNDFALMVGTYPKLLTMRWSCEGYKVHDRYDAYGISGYGINMSVFRQYKVIATSTITDENFLVGKMDGSSKRVPVPGMRELRGYIVPGMSGGPIARSDNGLIVGMNNVGTFFFDFLVQNVAYSFELKNTILCKR